MPARSSFREKSGQGESGRLRDASGIAHPTSEAKDGRAGAKRQGRLLAAVGVVRLPLSPERRGLQRSGMNAQLSWKVRAGSPFGGTPSA